MNRLFFLLLLWLMTLGSSVSAWAQQEPGQLRFEHVTVNEGLSHSDAMAVVQDQQGFIWIGTNNGVNRYDGYTVKTYLLPIDNVDGLSNNRVRALHVSRQGTVWVGTEGGGLNVYRPDQDRFVRLTEERLPAGERPLFRRLAQAELTAISSDRRGAIWVGTRQLGLFRLIITADKQLQSLAQVRLQGEPSDQCEITDLVTDSVGTIWAATLEQGLFRAPVPDGQPRAERAVLLPQKRLLALTIDRRGDLWLGTDESVIWVSRHDLQASQFRNLHTLPGTFPGIGCLYHDSFDRLWIGTNFGLSVVPLQTLANRPPQVIGKATTFVPLDDEPMGINSGRIHAILEDRFQVLWLAASAGGLNKVDLLQKPFGQLRRQQNQHPTLPNNYINAIYKEEGRNLLWIATRNGFSSYNLVRKTYRNYLTNSLPGNVTGIDVSCIFQASDSTLWFGTRYDGLVSLRRQQGRDVLTTYPQQAGPFRHLETITEDRFGSLWLATFYNGLIRMDHSGKVLANYTAKNSPLPTDRFTFLLYDKATDVLWASTQNAGVLKLRVRPDRLELLAQYKHDPRNPNSLRVNYAWPLLKDRRGILWVGTIGGGLHQIIPAKNGPDQVRTCTGWLPDSDVESILTDEQGNLWCGGLGLLKINPQTRQLIRYDAGDGVQSNSFKIGAAYRATDGTLYFGGINGITYLQPRRIQANPYPPLVRITGVSLANRPIAVGELVDGRVLIPQSLDTPQSIAIRDQENDFSIAFVGLNFANPKKHKYAYQLVGYNDTWVTPAPDQRTASFANLPAGDYTFRVKADNGEGQWSAQPATLHITVLPPWWRTWWAYCLYALVIGGALFLAQRLLLHEQALKNKVAYEHFQYEKEKELTDLKLRFFTNVSHELRTPLTLIMGPMDELAAAASKLSGMKDKVLLMHQQTRRLLSLINQLLDFRRMESVAIPLRVTQGDIGAFLTELFLMFRLKAQEKEIQFTFAPPADLVFLYFDRSKLEVVIINLLANALKYTPAGRRVSLRMRTVGNAHQEAIFNNKVLLDNYLEISVTDEGNGMNASELDRIFDLYYQASQTETMRIVGSGIGLSLVKQFVERHQGTVCVASQLNTGTTFTIRLPFGHRHLAPADLADESEVLVLPNEPALSGPVSSANEPLARPVLPSPQRVLVVEDNDEVRTYLTGLFSTYFEVLTAADGAEGWERTQHLQPDLVISDIMMPNSSGLELCRKIKQHPKTLHIPVLLLTARIAAAHELEGLETGADDYVGKPFNPELLMARANMLLNNRLKLRQYYQQQILLQPADVVIPDADRLFLEKAMQLVETNLNNPDFSAQWLNREMGISRSVFFRRIKSMTGQSVVEFINAVRMKRAAQLLSTGQLRVSEVCELVGLEDLKYFRKSFQQLHGVSPSDYYKKAQLDKVAC